MEPRQSTTPFGRRPLSLAMVASQTIAKECPHGVAVHKWQVFRAICEGRELLNVSERALSVLNALLTFHPETTLAGQGDLVVFPSNQQLALRAHGMAPATLRRHLGVLVEAGIVIRRDSPNGKRYARKSADGAIEKAFGFDLSPFVARASEFERLADNVRTERRAVHDLRERITLARRDIVKMIVAAQDAGIPGNWAARHADYVAVMKRLPRTANSATLAPIAGDLDRLAEQIRIILEKHVNLQNMNANESHSEHHIQNSNPKPTFESEQDFQGSLAASVKQTPPGPDRHRRTFPLALVLQACPDIVDYARNGIASWRDLRATIDLVRGMQGISPSAWEDACAIFGDDDASTIVAAILQRGAAIKSPGAYLRGLTEKGRQESFSPGPMIMALLRSHVQALRRA